MVRFLPPEFEADGLGLKEIVAGAVDHGLAEPAWIAVDDGSRQWLSLVAGCPAAERAAGVVVTADDTTLLEAHRLGVGGAAALPASTPGLIDALESASRTSPPPVTFEPGAMEIFDRADDLEVVTLSNRAFWRAQLGDRVLSRMLAELAIGMRSPPAVVPWPALILSEHSEREIKEAWKPLAAGAGRPADDLVVSKVAPGSRGVVAAVYSTLIEQVEHLHAVKTVAAEPVYELPSGKLVGHWASEPGPQPKDGWLAAPFVISGPTCRWQLVDGSSKITVEDVLEVADIDRIEGAAAVRIPGMLTGNLRAGTPAGLLVQRLADAASRRGVPLWVPNVATEDLRFALRLPGTVWVDGPAVPR